MRQLATAARASRGRARRAATLLLRALFFFRADRRAQRAVADRRAGVQRVLATEADKPYVPIDTSVVVPRVIVDLDVIVNACVVVAITALTKK